MFSLRRRFEQFFEMEMASTTTVANQKEGAVETGPAIAGEAVSEKKQDLRRPYFKQVGSPTDPTRPRLWYSRCGDKNQAYLNIRRQTLKGEQMKLNFKMDRVPEVISYMTFYYLTTRAGDLEEFRATLRSCLERCDQEEERRNGTLKLEIS